MKNVTANILMKQGLKAKVIKKGIKTIHKEIAKANKKKENKHE